MTTNEAKLLGKPIVVAGIPSMREQFVHGETAYIVNRPAVDDFFEGICFMLNHPEKQKVFRNNLKNFYIHCNDSISLIEKILYNE